MQSIGDDPHILRRRLAAFVRERTSSTKELARLVPCDIRTAENMRAGHWPIARHWLGLLRAFGEDVTEAVFHPEKATERLVREVLELEDELERKRLALRRAGGFGPGAAEVAAAANEDRAAR